MPSLLALFLGLLIGWFVEWIVDVIYWRRRFKEMKLIELRGLQREAELQKELDWLKQESTRLLERNKFLEKRPTGESKTAPKIEEPIVPTTPDNLQKIKGIGPVISKKLNEAGVFTYEQLAEQTPDTLRKMLGSMIERLADEGVLIEQAHQLALQKGQKRSEK